MSNTYKLDYKRSVLRGVSDLISTTSMLAMKLQAYQRMTESDWLEVAEPISSLPVHWWNHSGFSDSYDAATFCGDYALGKQKSYACASCYTIKIPRDAQTGIPAKIEAVLATVRGDRWLSDGAIVSAFISNSETPPSWQTIIDTDNPSYLLSSPDPAPAIDEETTLDWQAPLRGVNRSNAADESAYAATITANTPIDAAEYLHIVIRMSDYLSVYKITLEGGVIKDNAWVEGGANIDGTTLQVQFSRAVSVVWTKTVELFKKKSITSNSKGPFFDINMFSEWLVLGDLRGLPAKQMYKYLMESVKTYPSDIWYKVGSDFNFKSDYVAAGSKTVVGVKGSATEAGVQAMVCSRTGMSSGGVLKNIRFANSVPYIEPGIPVGVTLRLSLYLAYPDYVEARETVSQAVIPNMIDDYSTLDYSFLEGSATSINIASASSRFDTDRQLFPLELTPVKTVDLTESIPENEVIPIDGDIIVKPGLVMLVACLSVHSFSDEYDADPSTNKNTPWNPVDPFYLTLEEKY